MELIINFSNKLENCMLTSLLTPFPASLLRFFEFLFILASANENGVITPSRTQAG
jgi:hypothetical protein